MHKRNLYMERVKPFIDKPVVKVITGLRRVGKSYFMRQIMEYLRDQSIDNQRIIYIDKESVDFDFINNYQQLDNYLKTRPETSPGRRNYLFIDEVQEIKGWEKCIASCQGNDTLDIVSLNLVEGEGGAEVREIMLHRFNADRKLLGFDVIGNLFG